MIVALVSDLLFESKLAATAAAIEVPLNVVRTPEALNAQLANAVGVIIDLTISTGDAVAAISATRAAAVDLPIIAFFPHVDAALGRSARAAGATEVLPRSKFAERLPEILARLAGRELPPETRG